MTTSVRESAPFGERKDTPCSVEQYFIIVISFTVQNMVLKLTEEAIHEILQSFNHLSTLLVDTSSLIRIEKAGFLPALTRAVRLCTIPVVQIEYLAGSAQNSFPAMVEILELFYDSRGQGHRKISRSHAGSGTPGSIHDPSVECTPGRVSALEPFHAGKSPIDPSLEDPAPGNPYSHGQKRVSTDALVLEAARANRLPLLSEDRKILLKAELLGLPYYNALMMLEFLFYRRVLSNDSYGMNRNGLLGQARYSNAVLRYVEALHTFILKERGG